MSANSTKVRSCLTGFATPLGRRACLRCLSNLAQQPRQQYPRDYSSAATDVYEPKHHIESSAGRPRWSYTPPQYTAPYRSKPVVEGNDFAVNEDPRVLDAAYERIFGRGGHKLLREETKWLAVTHKSFDHAKRGYNERLAVLGSPPDVAISLALVHGSNKRARNQVDDQHQRQPFLHPALDGVEALTYRRKETILSKENLGSLAEDFGLHEVMRWHPLRAVNMKVSGRNRILVETIYAIIGALSLEQGAIVANHIVRERIVSRLLSV